MRLKMISKQGSEVDILELVDIHPVYLRTLLDRATGRLMGTETASSKIKKFTNNKGI